MEPNEPIVLPPDLQRLVDQARDDIGDAARLDAVAARLEPRFSAAPSQPLRWLVRPLLGALLAGGLAVAILRAAHRPTVHPVAVPALPPTASLPPSALPVEPAPLASDAPSGEATPPAPSSPPRSSAAGPGIRHAPSSQPTASATPAPDPIVREHEILARARRSLDSNPSGTLEAVAEHQRRFPNGTLSSEREFLRVVALARLGRTSEARAARDAFVARWPSSAYRNEIDRQLGP